MNRTAQREIATRNRGNRIEIPVTSHPLDPWRSKTNNLMNSSQSVDVYCSGNAIDAQIRQEVPFIVISKVCVDLKLKGGNHICVLRQLDAMQEYIGLRTSTEEHVMLRLESEVQEVATAKREDI